MREEIVNELVDHSQQIKSLEDALRRVRYGQMLLFDATPEELLEAEQMGPEARSCEPKDGTKVTAHSGATKAPGAGYPLDPSPPTFSLGVAGIGGGTL